MSNIVTAILATLASFWSLILLLMIMANIRGHRLQDRNLKESIAIEIIVWVAGAGIFAGMVQPVWGYIIPSIEQAGGGRQVSLPKLPSFLEGSGGDQQIPFADLAPTSAPDLFLGPTPIATGGDDQIVRNYRASDGTTQCLFTADSGDEGGANIIALADRLGVPCVVIAGDVIYPNGSMENFHGIVEPYLGPRIANQSVFVGPGNHDWWRGYPDNISLSWTAAELPLCQAFPYLPQGQGKCRYYRVLLSDDVEVFFFDSDFREPDGNIPGSTQERWMQAALTNSTATWKIVVTHEPPVSSCNHEASSAVASIAWTSYGTDALFSGHCHFYERSEIDGLPVFTVGNGGNSIYPFVKDNPESRYRYNASQGAVVMTASPSNLTFNFVTTSGEIEDTLTLSK